jgi:hypothetical protein
MSGLQQLPFYATQATHTPSISGLQHSTFRGVHELLTNESERPHQEDIDDDLEGEKETLAELTSDEITTERMKRQWRESVGEASKGVTEKTNDGYQRFFFLSSFN